MQRHKSRQYPSKNQAIIIDDQCIPQILVARMVDPTTMLEIKSFWRSFPPTEHYFHRDVLETLEFLLVTTPPNNTPNY